MPSHSYAYVFMGIFALALACFLAGPRACLAQSDAVKQFSVGDFTVFSIQDRAAEMPASIFSGPLTPAEKQKAMPGGKAPASVNVFIVKGGGRNIMIDAGYGEAGPGENHFIERLRSAGFSPDDIDMVLLTHTHPDHIGGLVSKEGEAVFAKARVLMSQAEFEFFAPVPPQPLEPASSPAADEARPNVALPDETRPSPLAGAPSPALEQATPEQAPPPAPAPITEPAAPAKAAAPGNKLAEAVLEAYSGRMAIFSFGEKPVEGLTAKNAVGHTPGHTAFLLESGGEKLLFIGDLLHAAALQFPYPEMCASYDRDQSQAVISRRNILNEAADLNMPVAGAHIPHSGVGLVAKSGDGFAFTVVPPAR